MKALQDRTKNLQAESVVTDLTVRIAMLFEQFPTLCGFSVQERSTLSIEHPVIELQAGLCVADVTVNTRSGVHAVRELCNEVARVLVELMDEHPDVLELLSGRTFARMLH